MAVQKADLYTLIDRLDPRDARIAYDFLSYLLNRVDPWAIIDRREADDVPMSPEEFRQWHSEDGCVSGREEKEEFGLSVDLP